MPYTADFNGEQPEGAGFFQVTQRRGRRVSTCEAYLAPARRRPGLRVEAGAMVTRVVLEKQRAVAVEFVDREGGVRVARAGREVILSAGALNSPKLLMLSGIGPAAHLRSMGIAPALDLAGVGRNLQDHVRVPVLFESGRASPGDMLYWIPGAMNYALRRRGVMSSNCCESGAFIRTDGGIPDLQFVTHFQSSLYPGTVDLQFCLLRTHSRGTVTLASADPSAPPVIDPGYFSAAEDLVPARRGLRLARELARGRALQRFPLRAEVLPGADVTTDREVECYVRSAAETCYHPAGTCRMGSDAEAVVDDRLRVRGVEGLRVIDASIMPELPNGNTCAPTLMIAEKGADLVKGVC
jgi:choline dehydrogenase-like flavoprotein